VTYANYTAGVQFDLGRGGIAQINYVGNTARRIRQAALTQRNQLLIGDLATYATLCSIVFRYIQRFRCCIWVLRHRRAGAGAVPAVQGQQRIVF
jgi:hypothetical protein